MTDGIFLCTAHLGTGFAGGRIEKHGIVAKAAVTFALAQNGASPNRLHNDRFGRLSGKGEHSRTVETAATTLVSNAAGRFAWNATSAADTLNATWILMVADVLDLAAAYVAIKLVNAMTLAQKPLLEHAPPRAA